MNPLGATLGRTFGALSELRGHRRSLHPDGAGFAATLTPVGEPPAVALLRDGPRDAQVRLSRSIGLPEPLPDILGLAVRVPDAYGPGRHQDLLLATTGRRRVARHLLVPAVGGFLAPTYSTLMPYRAGDELVTIAAFPASEDAAPLRLGGLRARREAGDVRFTLAVAAPTGGWRPVAELVLGERLDPAAVERLRFDPANTGGGLELAGPLQGLRHPAYRGSQLHRV